MQRFRKILFWCHLAAGVTAGAIILIMSVTGVLLTYERQMIRRADARAYTVTSPAPDAARLPIETLIARAREAKPDAAPTGVTLRADERAPVEINFGREGALFVDPYTAEVYGEGAKSTRAFFRAVTDLHRWLALSGDGRPAGRAITGACNLLFLFIVASGFYLWFPRRLAWKQIKNVLWFRGGLSGKARDFNWHNVIGFWTALPLFIVVLSGVVISYQWAGDLVYRVVGERPPTRQNPGDDRSQGGNRPRGDAAQTPPADFDALIARAQAHVPGWRSVVMQLPTKADAPVAFTIDRADGGQPQHRAQLQLDQATGEVKRFEPFGAQTPGRRLRSILRFAHTGEVLGLAGQTIAGLASLGACVLVWTGLALSWRRLRAWRAPRTRAVEGE